MLDISESQELTLYRWAKAHSTRPLASDKEFLLDEKGLTAEQIDAWWDRMGPPSQAGVLTGLDSSNELGLHSQSEHLSCVAAGSNTQFNEQGIHTSYLFPSFSAQNTHMSLASCYTDITPKSDRSSMATSNSAFSQTSWDPLILSKRSSDVSFATSFNSISSNSKKASTTSSSLDLTMLEEDYSSQNEACINPVDLTIRPGISSHWIQNKPAAPLPLFTDISIPSTTPLSANDCDTQPTPPLPSKANPPKNHTNFACTTCQTRFPSKKHEWKRHESSQCDPQTSWICMLGNPAILTSSSPFGAVPGSCTYTCAFCLSILSRDEMNVHLAMVHNIASCFRRPPSHPQRVFQRKDKFREHLVKKHGLLKGTEGVWETWSRPVEPAKKAWGCGFCGSCWWTWEGRLEHVANHFEEGLEVGDWSMDLEIKGLLRQKKDVHEAWKTLLERNGVDERLVRWEKHVRLDLKRKLEYGMGKPREVADEVLKGAISVKGHTESATEMAASLLTSNRMTAWPVAVVRSTVPTQSHRHHHTLGSNHPPNGRNRSGDWEMNDDIMI